MYTRPMREAATRPAVMAAASVLSGATKPYV